MLEFFIEDLITIDNYKTSEIGIIKYITDKVTFNEFEINTVKSILNQSEVLKAFRKGKVNLKFDLDETRNFLNWVKRMSKEDKQHTFFIYNCEDEIVGAVEFQRVDIETATVGYWANKDKSGFMTNAVLALLPIAKKEFGLKSFNSYAALDNLKSLNLLKRTGFREDKVVTNPQGIKLIKFLLTY